MQPIRCPQVLATLVVAAIAPSFPAQAQPAPSFKASCESVEAELKKLNPQADTLITIEVEGTLSLVEFDGAIAYMGLCGSPTPKVMCITYSIEGWKVGDKAILSGGYNPGSSNTIILDPCLPARPDGG